MEKASIANRQIITIVLTFLSNEEQLSAQLVCRDWYGIKIPLTMPIIRLSTLAFSFSKQNIVSMLKTNPGSEIW